MNAVTRNGCLWICQMVGLNGTNGACSGDESGSAVDHSAIQWFKLKMSADHTALNLEDYGRVFDPQDTNGWWYHFPSLAVNCAGDMVTGFSGSSRTNYIGAFFTWRPASGVVPDQPWLIQEGTIRVGGVSLRWGDYSATTVDPTDDWSFWTVQEYAAPVEVIPGGYAGRFGTVVARIRPDP